MSRYDELDKTILAKLRICSRRWSDLHAEMERLHPGAYFGRHESWRITDGRLQALRRKGLIRAVRVGSGSFWEVVP